MSIKEACPEPMVYLYTNSTFDSSEANEFIALNSERYERNHKRMRSLYLSMAVGMGCMFIGTLIGLIVLACHYDMLYQEMQLVTANAAKTNSQKVPS